MITDIKKAEKILSPYWPLPSFIATNPLWHYFDKSFLATAKHLASIDINLFMPTNYYINLYNRGDIDTEKIVSAYNDVFQDSIRPKQVIEWMQKVKSSRRMEENHLLYAEQIPEFDYQNTKKWMKEFIFKSCLDLDFYSKNGNCLVEIVRNKLKALDIDNINTNVPTNEAEAISFIMKELQVDTNKTSLYLTNIYKELYGWSSFAKWLSDQPDNPWLSINLTPTMLLVAWLTIELYIHKKTNINYRNIAPKANDLEAKNCYVLQKALEDTYASRLISKIQPHSKTEIDAHSAQFIFCIDTRSEGLRRHIEHAGNYQTFGYAGFYNVNFKLNNDDKITYQSPGIVRPAKDLHLTNTISKPSLLIKKINRLITLINRKTNASLFFVELVGSYYAFLIGLKSLLPHIKQKNEPKALSFINLYSSYSENEITEISKSFLTTIGLIENFAPYIFICGHQSDNINNPFSASLQCGACGGNAGQANAKVITDFLNDSSNRVRLKKYNIDIPAGTRFIDSIHHTVDDRLTFSNKNILPQSILDDLTTAARGLKSEKQHDKSLGLASHAFSERNWAELIPEYGLINNYAMVIGARKHTRGINCERQVFLHSYEHSNDDSGEMLANILSGPGVVAQHINAQYYFSTVAPDIFSAGNKVLHNILPDIGVMEGNVSDLKVGLPLQSIYFKNQPIHIPRRLTIIVYCPENIMQQALAKSPIMSKLIENNWVLFRHVAV